jgi:hypothetical protein
MSDPQPSQNPGQYQGQNPPPAPCDDPKPPEPKPPELPKCPPTDECPKPKPCPEPPTRPPDPCDEGGGSTGTSTYQPATGGTVAATPAAHLADLKKKYEEGQKKLQELEPLKGALADLSQRIQAFEKTIDGQSASETAYKDYYRTIERLRSDIICFTPTARCQLELTDKQKKCICDAIKAVDERVAKAKKDAADQKTIVDNLDRDSRKSARDLEWAKKWYDYLKTDLQAQISKQRDDLGKVKGLVTPAASPCDAFFYLYELERLTQSSYGTAEACWKDDIWISTFLDCWPWENYSQVWNKALVDFNKADAADKLVKSQLEQAKKLLGDLDKAAADAVGKRREWILKEIKPCCGPNSKCP